MTKPSLISLQIYRKRQETAKPAENRYKKFKEYKG